MPVLLWLFMLEVYLKCSPGKKTLPFAQTASLHLQHYFSKEPIPLWQSLLNWLIIWTPWGPRFTVRVKKGHYQKGQNESNKTWKKQPKKRGWGENRSRLYNTRSCRKSSFVSHFRFLRNVKKPNLNSFANIRLWVTKRKKKPVSVSSAQEVDGTKTALGFMVTWGLVVVLINSQGLWGAAALVSLPSKCLTVETPQAVKKLFQL